MEYIHIDLNVLIARTVFLYSADENTQTDNHLTLASATTGVDDESHIRQGAPMSAMQSAECLGLLQLCVKPT